MAPELKGAIDLPGYMRLTGFERAVICAEVERRLEQNRGAIDLDDD